MPCACVSIVYTLKLLCDADSVIKVALPQWIPPCRYCLFATEQQHILFSKTVCFYNKLITCSLWDPGQTDESRWDSAIKITSATKVAGWWKWQHFLVFCFLKTRHSLTSLHLIWKNVGFNRNYCFNYVLQYYVFSKCSILYHNQITMVPSVLLKMLYRM